MTTLTLPRQPAQGMTRDERRVIFASSLGTVFEWYDFYLYATLAPFFAALFFPPGNDTAALLSAFATYAAGFLVRPFGALIFGRIGDLVGRKYTFLVTIAVMGGATFGVGLLPTFATMGWLAPILLVTLRLLQGLALGGEYGGAATYVAEHARPDERGYATSFIQTTATLGFFLALLVIGLARFESATGATAEIYSQIKKATGSVPNTYAAIGAHGPAALKAMLAADAVLASGTLAKRDQETVKLVVSGVTGCDYCEAAHSLLGKLAGLKPDELKKIRDGQPTGDAKRDALVRFVRTLAETSGTVSDDDFAAIKAAGYTDAQLVDISLAFATIIFTNVFNRINDTEIDFPAVA
jgi:uncharacterized peroxidase-related enzyme